MKNPQNVHSFENGLQQIYGYTKLETCSFCRNTEDKQLGPRLALAWVIIQGLNVNAVCYKNWNILEAVVWFLEIWTKFSFQNFQLNEFKKSFLIIISNSSLKVNFNDAQRVVFVVFGGWAEWSWDTSYLHEVSNQKFALSGCLHQTSQHNINLSKEWCVMYIKYFLLKKELFNPNLRSQGPKRALTFSGA